MKICRVGFFFLKLANNHLPAASSQQDKLLYSCELDYCKLVKYPLELQKRILTKRESGEESNNPIPTFAYAFEIE